LPKKGKRRKKSKKSSFPAGAVFVIGLLALVTGLILTLSGEGYLGKTGQIIEEKREMLTKMVRFWEKKTDDSTVFNDPGTEHEDLKTGERTAEFEEKRDYTTKTDSDRPAQPEQKKTGDDSPPPVDKPSVKLQEERRKTIEKQPTTSVIAIVIDDFGNSWKNVEEFCSLDVPITFAVLPKLPYSEKSARAAVESGKEIILHLPLENHTGKNPGPGTIKTGMKQEEITRQFEENLATVPGAVGFNNHEGSKATEDEELMKILMRTAGKHKLFFLDSRTSMKSVAYDAASRARIPSTSRHVFIDNKDDFEHIVEQLNLLIDLAIEKGSAVGIGHCRENTYLAIKEVIPKTRKKNVDFVFVSELVE
jgi:polysaccharide deacetylase 2 family uncharacterized protein YibQ